MIQPDLIVRTNRRSLSISINNLGEVIVRAPKKLSINNIIKFLTDKEKWIIKKQQEIKTIINKNTDVLNNSMYLYLDKKYIPKAIAGIKTIELGGTNIYYPNKLTNQLEIKSLIKTWYIKEAKELLTERINYLSKIMKVHYNLFGLTNSHTKWGTCDKIGNIKLNYRLIMLPPKIIDFIIIHELAHLIELNHSKRFYKILDAIIPDHMLIKKQLRDYDYLLKVL